MNESSDFTNGGHILRLKDIEVGSILKLSDSALEIDARVTGDIQRTLDRRIPVYIVSVAPTLEFKSVFGPSISHLVVISECLNLRVLSYLNVSAGQSSVIDCMCFLGENFSGY